MQMLVSCKQSQVSKEQFWATTTASYWALVRTEKPKTKPLTQATVNPYLIPLSQHRHRCNSSSQIATKNGLRNHPTSTYHGRRNHQLRHRCKSCRLSSKIAQISIRNRKTKTLRRRRSRRIRLPNPKPEENPIKSSR